MRQLLAVVVVRIAVFLFALGAANVGYAQSLTVVAASHHTQEHDYTITTPQQSNTNCTSTSDTSVNCNTTTYGGTSQENAVYRLTEVVTANQNGQMIRYTLSRVVRWRWTSMDWLTDGDSFPAEIKGKHMYITCRKGGNQGKKETLKYDILDIRPVE
jgi:hypothetical protein